MKVEITSNMKFFKLYPRGREDRSWGIIGAFRFVRSQSTTEIFPTPNHTESVYNASVTQLLSLLEIGNFLKVVLESLSYVQEEPAVSYR